MNNQGGIEVKDLIKHFPVTSGVIFSRLIGVVKAVDGISFSIGKGKTFGLVGESGCGKSTTVNMILGLEKPTSGDIYIDGENIIGLKRKKVFDLRRKVQAVFQDPFRSLNPRKKIKQIISEPLVVHKIGTKQQRYERVLELMELVGLKPETAEHYPHEFSGGQRQRIAFARALSLNPEMIILDEPVSALDVSIQAQVVNLLIDIQQKLKVTYIVISHDLAVVEHISDKIGVMYLGQLVELAPVKDLYGNPLHPYTKALLASVPVADPENIRESVLEGEVPSPLNPPPGCNFHPRCSKMKPECKKGKKILREITPGHFSSCPLFT